MKLSRLTLCCALLLSGLSCGADKGSMTINDFCNQRAARECAVIGTMFCAVADVTKSCEPLRAAECVKQAATQTGSTRQFRTENADACLDEVKKVYAKNLITPAEFDSIDDLCSRVFEGTAKKNDPCTNDYECDGKTLICDKGFCGERVIKKADENCANPGEVCVIGTVCQRVGQVSLCKPKRAETMECAADQPCLEALYCAAGVCRPRLDTRSPCTADDQCQSGYCSPEFKECAVGLTIALYSPQCAAFGGSSMPAARDAGADGP